jgi:hypothetical protein
MASAKNALRATSSTCSLPPKTQQQSPQFHWSSSIHHADRMVHIHTHTCSTALYKKKGFATNILTAKIGPRKPHRTLLPKSEIAIYSPGPQPSLSGKQITVPHHTSSLTHPQANNTFPGKGSHASSSQRPTLTASWHSDPSALAATATLTRKGALLQGRYRLRKRLMPHP